jgi:hypothetical protein
VTAIGRHSCRSGHAPSSAAAWCVTSGPHGVLASGGAWTLDPAGERLQEAGSGGSRKRAWRRRRGGCARRPFGGSGIRCNMELVGQISLKSKVPKIFSKFLLKFNS